MISRISNRSLDGILLIGLCALLCIAQSPSGAAQAPDSNVKILQPGVRVTQLAQHPDLVTPTGIQIDESGNLWVVACHTHFRPATYQGPENDEILVFDSQGKNRRVFYNKTKTTMQLLLGGDGWLYIAQRDRVLRVRDSDGDGVGDLEEPIATLETLADYPHNGLSGMTWHTDGGLIFSLGENFGKDWSLRGSDGGVLTGRGEGGVFHCTKQGRELRRIAKGFWNPFGLWMRDDGILFAAENDPGSRPPCRLLHVVEGGDYGFQYVYGSASVHPFVCWNGELRGTLGMIHSSGEGPCAVVGLGGGVMVPSWSNHCIDYYPLRWQGATLVSDKIELLRGSDMFRPVAMVRKNDREYYFTDWVSPSYELHGLGRLWKLEIDPEQATWIQRERVPATPEAALAERLRTGKGLTPQDQELPRLMAMIQGDDSFMKDAAQSALARIASEWGEDKFRSLSSPERLWSLVALRKSDFSNPKWVRMVWRDSDPEVRFECLRWIADGVWKEFLPEVQQCLADPNLDYRLFEAGLAALNTLQGNPSAGVTDTKQLIERVLDPQASPRVVAYALRLIPPQEPRLTMAALRELVGKPDEELRREVIRTLAMRKSEEAREMLLAIARDSKETRSNRLDAIAGLVGADKPEIDKFLMGLAQNPSDPLGTEAERVLRSKATAQENASSKEDKRTAEEWLKAIDALPGVGDPEAGRRIFFHAAGAACSQCHRFDGRGNVVGPELSLVGRQGSRLQILQSIIDPNREVAPQFYTTFLELADGSQFTGILLRSSSNEVYRNNFGEEVTFQKRDIVERRELRSSMMPKGLLSTMNEREVRDLLAFLTQHQ